MDVAGASAEFDGVGEELGVEQRQVAVADDAGRTSHHLGHVF